MNERFVAVSTVMGCGICGCFSKQSDNNIHDNVSRINAPAYSFPVRVVTLWNRLPAATVLAQNLKQFKKSINEY